MKHLLWASLACASLAACGGSESEPVAEAAPDSAEAAAPAETAPIESEDALVEGTDYNATAQVQCGFDGAAPTQSCEAGVKRNWGEDGSNLVEVQKPDGSKRAIFFTGTTAFGADSAEADGSAGWEFETSTEGDRITVRFGPETYVIVDALITGG